MFASPEFPAVEIRQRDRGRQLARFRLGNGDRPCSDWQGRTEMRQRQVAPRRRAARKSLSPDVQPARYGNCGYRSTTVGHSSAGADLALRGLTRDRTGLLWIARTHRPCSRVQRKPAKIRGRPKHAM